MRDRGHDGLARVARATEGARPRAWLPTDAVTGLGLRAWVTAETATLEPTDNPLQLERVLLGAPDLSGNGNDFDGLVGAPVWQRVGMRGRPCFYFDGSTGLRCEGFDWGGTGFGTVAVLVQHDEVASSDTVWGYNGARPYLRTLTPGAAMQVTTSGGSSNTAKSLHGPSVVVCRWGGPGTNRSIWVDGVEESVVVDPNSAPNNLLRMALGYDGASTPARHTKCRIAGFVVYRGALSDAEVLRLTEYMQSLAPLPSARRVRVSQLGQSNGMAKDIQLFPRLVKRRDILAARDNSTSSGPVREQTPWGPLGNAWEATLERGACVEMMAQLNDERGIRAHLFNSAYTGIGFYTSTGTPDLWIPPSLNAGVGGVAFQRAMDLITSTVAAHPDETACDEHVVLWCHGETDALNATAAANYGASLTAFLNDMKAALGEEPRVVVVQLHAGYTGGTLTNRNNVRAGMAAAVAAYGPRATLLDVDAYALQVDNTHWSGAMATSIATDVCDLIEGWV